MVGLRKFELSGLHCGLFQVTSIKWNVYVVWIYFCKIKEGKIFHNVYLLIKKIIEPCFGNPLFSRYVSMFLAVKDQYAPAHKLMAQILERSSTPDDIKKSISYYKRSFELDDSQKQLTLKSRCCTVPELLSTWYCIKFWVVSSISV